MTNVFFSHIISIEVNLMLMRFNVKNFLSFGERENAQSEEFSLFAGKVRNKYDHVYNDGKVKLLKFSAIYGANASGKSNFVKSLDFMRKFVLNQSITGYMNSYCKVNEENKNKNSYFQRLLPIHPDKTVRMNRLCTPN